MMKTLAQEANSKSGNKVLLDARSVTCLGFYLFHNRFDLIPALPRFLDKIQECCNQPITTAIDPLTMFESTFNTKEEIEIFFIYLFLKPRMDTGLTNDDSTYNSKLMDGHGHSGLIAEPKFGLIIEANARNAKTRNTYQSIDNGLFELTMETFIEIIPLLNRAMFIKLILESDKVIHLLQLLYSHYLPTMTTSVSTLIMEDLIDQ